MADLRISQLPELQASALTQNAEFAVAQAGTTYKITQGTLSPFPVVYGLFSQTGTSSTVSGTTEQTIIGGGVGTLGVPANGFRPGDSFHAVIRGHLSNNNDDMRIRVKSDSIALGDSGLINYNTSGDDVLLSLDIYFTVNKIGGAGTAEILTKGFLKTTKSSNFTVNGYAFTSINNTTFNTTIPNTLDVTWQFDATDPSTYVYSDYLVLNKVY